MHLHGSIKLVVISVQLLCRDLQRKYALDSATPGRPEGQQCSALQVPKGASAADGCSPDAVGEALGMRGCACMLRHLCQ